MSAVDWVCKKISLESASEQLSAITISRQQECFPANLTHAQTLPLAVDSKWLHKERVKQRSLRAVKTILRARLFQKVNILQQRTVVLLL